MGQNYEKKTKNETHRSRGRQRDRLRRQRQRARPVDGRRVQVVAAASGPWRRAGAKLRRGARAPRRAAPPEPPAGGRLPGGRPLRPLRDGRECHRLAVITDKKINN